MPPGRPRPTGARVPSRRPRCRLADITCLQEKKNIQLVMKEGQVYADRRPGGASKNVVNAQPGSWKIIDYL